MSQHLLLKFWYSWEDEKGNFLTISEHTKIIMEKGYCWFGCRSALNQEKSESLKRQIQEGTDTKIFLYSIWVPHSLHKDGILWYVADLLDVNLGTPADKNGIPGYYRTLDLPVYFKIGNIRAIDYKAGLTPKVPGQAALRHVSFSGMPQPENLRSVKDPSALLCRKTNFECEIPEISQPALPDTIAPSKHIHSSFDLRDKVIDLQDEVVSLYQQITELRSFRDYYNKILNTDYLFSSEKFLETWVQENIHRIFPEVDILERQSHAKWDDGKFGRLDLIGMNKETKGLVIIEIKTRKRSSKSGYDQYLRYTSWAKRNLAQLLSEYDSKGLKDTGKIDFIIVTDHVDEEMKAICKDHGITLVHIFGGLGIERVA